MNMAKIKEDIMRQLSKTRHVGTKILALVVACTVAPLVASGPLDDPDTTALTGEEAKTPEEEQVSEEVRCGVEIVGFNGGPVTGLLTGKDDLLQDQGMDFSVTVEARGNASKAPVTLMVSTSKETYTLKNTFEGSQVTFTVKVEKLAQTVLLGAWIDEEYCPDEGCQSNCSITRGETVQMAYPTSMISASFSVAVALLPGLIEQLLARAIISWCRCACSRQIFIFLPSMMYRCSRW